jgi:hypothetical protein
MAVSESRGVLLCISTNSRHLEDDECGLGASRIPIRYTKPYAEY